MRRTKPAIGVLLFFLGLYGLTFHGYVDNEDIEVSFEATRSLVEEGHLAIGDSEVGKLIKEEEFFVVRAEDGEHYPIYPIAQFLYQAPFYALGTWVAQFSRHDPESVVRMVFTSVNVLAGAWLCMVVYLLTRALGYTERISVVTALLAGCGTMLWAYAQGGFADLPMSLCVAYAVLYLIRAERRAFWCVPAGLALGLAIAIRPSAGLIVLPCLWFLRGQGFARWFWFLLPAALVVAGLVYVDHFVFERPFEASYAGKARLDPPVLTESYTLALLGIVLSDGKGVLMLSPILWLAVLALPGWLRHDRAATILLFGPFVVLTLWFAAFSGWYGGACWGTRYLLPAVPLLAVGMAPWLARPGLRARLVTIALAVITLWIQVLSVAVPHRMYCTLTTRSAHDVTAFFYYPKFSPVLAHQRILLRKLRGEPDVFAESWLFDVEAFDHTEHDLTRPISSGISRYNRGFEHFAFVRLIQRQHWVLASAGLLACVLGIAIGLQSAWSGSRAHPLPSATRKPNNPDST